jgi:hypothetical protein
VVLAMLQEIKLLVNTTPSALAKVASRLLFTPRIHPSSAEEGSFRSAALRDSSTMLIPSRGGNALDAVKCELAVVRCVMDLSNYRITNWLIVRCSPDT